ncbi:MAG: ACT domain-containing protein [Verrucomicrobiota bacterium]
MKSSILLITASGPDRPGIVHELARRVFEHKGNWERSRLIHLAGRFIGLLQISVPETFQKELEKDLFSIDGLDLTIAEGTVPATSGKDGIAMSLVGADHPGIVAEVFGALAKLGLNVESMSTRTEAAADSGTLLFHARATLTAQTPISIDEVRAKLESIASDLLVELAVEEA